MPAGVGMGAMLGEFLDKKNVFAVVGVSRDPEKYGYKVYRDLKSGGYTVYAVNPKLDEIMGDRCFHSLGDLPVVPDVASIVVPPGIAELIVHECKELGIKKVWLQPGSESEKAIAFCRENGILALHGVCVMVERRKGKAPE